jgi:hypothetical protein
VEKRQKTFRDIDPALSRRKRHPRHLQSLNPTRPTEPVACGFRLLYANKGS